MIIKNASVYTPEHTFEQKDIYIDGELFGREGQGDEVDAQGLLAIPGLIDIHTHGCMGHDFCGGTEEDLDVICKYEGEHGVTAVVPASMTLSEEELTSIFTNAANYTQKENAALFCGINMEGPFFSPAKKGAQNGTYLQDPSYPLFTRLQKAANGLIKIVCIAPELPGALEFIRKASPYVTISIAHTMADYDRSEQAFQSGATHVTHLYNAMPAFTHRAPGVIGAAASYARSVELISDGVHIHPAVIRATYQMFGDDRICLISDSMMATGLTDGMYSLGGQPVKVTGNLATLSDGTIAGSATNLFDCMRHAVSFGVPLESAVRMASENPAKEVGLFSQMGSIEEGKLANLVLMDKDLNIKAVYIKGKALSLPY